MNLNFVVVVVVPVVVVVVPVVVLLWYKLFPHMIAIVEL